MAEIGVDGQQSKVEFGIDGHYAGLVGIAVVVMDGHCAVAGHYMVVGDENVVLPEVEAAARPIGMGHFIYQFVYFRIHKA